MLYLCLPPKQSLSARGDVLEKGTSLIRSVSDNSCCTENLQVGAVVCVDQTLWILYKTSMSRLHSGERPSHARFSIEFGDRPPHLLTSSPLAPSPARPASWFLIEVNILFSASNISTRPHTYINTYKMRSVLSTIFVASLAALAAAQDGPETGQLGNATVVSNNPVGLIYVATLPEKQFNNPDDPRGNVKGSISATASSNGIGVEFQVNFQNLPTSGGPFLYHIHVAPVPENGNCTSTLAHQDPFIRGELTPCNETLPQTCQVGDLSGKHGKITSDPFTDSYTDDFASTTDGLGSFFGNRSFVIHFANKTRITCGNFALLTDEDGGNKPNATATGSPSPTGTAPAQFTGAASSLQVQSVRGVMVLGFVASAFMLFA